MGILQRACCGFPRAKGYRTWNPQTSSSAAGSGSRRAKRESAYAKLSSSPEMKHLSNATMIFVFGLQHVT
jgi:hypothetical protein